MFVQIWPTALIAAMASLFGNPLWAQDSWPAGGFATGYAPPPACCAKDKDCCKEVDCCKDGKCCKEVDCCKDGKCDCAKGDKCCCKKGECECKKVTACEGIQSHGFIVVVPAMQTMDAIAAMPHPIMPMPASPLAPPGLPNMPPPPACMPPFMHASMIPAPPAYYQQSSPYEYGYPTMAYHEAIPCNRPRVTSILTVSVKRGSEAKVCFVAASSDEALTVQVGEDTQLHCQRTKVTIGANELRLTRFEDRIRVRGENVKATADRVRSEGKDRLVLEGDVVLYYKKDGHKTHASGDCVEVNLTTGAVTISPSLASPE